MAMRLLSIKAVAEETGTSEWMLRDLIASGDLPEIRPPNLRRIYIDRRDLDLALAAWKERRDGLTLLRLVASPVPILCWPRAWFRPVSTPWHRSITPTLVEIHR